jgi:hypothetical protein
MENNKLKNDPFIAAFVFDNANDHLLKATGGDGRVQTLAGMYAELRPDRWHTRYAYYGV